MFSDCWNPAFATLPVMWLLHCLYQISVRFPPVSMVSSHEVCLSSVCLGRETSGPWVPGADHLDQRQDYSDRRPPHRWQTWYPRWVRARLPLLTHITPNELWRNDIFVFFRRRCGAQSVLGAHPVHRLPQQAPAAMSIPEAPSVLGRRLEGSAREQTPVKKTSHRARNARDDKLCFDG